MIADISHRIEAISLLFLRMESHDQNMLEKNVAQIEVWESAFQGQEDIAMEALASLDKANEKAADLTEKKMYVAS